MLKLKSLKNIFETILGSTLNWAKFSAFKLTKIKHVYDNFGALGAVHLKRKRDFRKN